MKKLLLTAACLLLSAATAAADCQRSTPLSPAASAVTVPLQNFTPAQGPAQEKPDPGDFSALGSAIEKGRPDCSCFTICEQTPTGCSCEGYTCDGIFYCAIPVC